jgi:hypothetical protein
LQVPVKKDNGKTAMVPAFQSLETIAGEVLPVVFLAFCVFALVFGVDYWHGVVIKWFAGVDSTCSG